MFSGRHWVEEYNETKEAKERSEDKYMGFFPRLEHVIVVELENEEKTFLSRFLSQEQKRTRRRKNKRQWNGKLKKGTHTKITTKSMKLLSLDVYFVSNFFDTFVTASFFSEKKSDQTQP